MQSSTQLSKRNHLLFPEMIVEKTINLESRRYIGNKTKLTNWIFENILNEKAKQKCLKIQISFLKNNKY